MATPDSLNCPETGNRCPATFPVVVRDAPLGPVGPPCLTGEVTPCGGPSPSLDECLGILPVAVYPQASVLAVLGDPQVDGSPPRLNVHRAILWQDSVLLRSMGSRFIPAHRSQVGSFKEDACCTTRVKLTSMSQPTECI